MTLDLDAVRARHAAFTDSWPSADRPVVPAMDHNLAADASADDVPNLLAALEEARRETERFHRESRDSAALHGRAVRELAAARAEVERLTKERDDATAALREANKTTEQLMANEWPRVRRAEAKRERMRPVVEAARAWQVARADQQGSGMAFHRCCSALAGALHTYESQENRWLTDERSSTRCPTSSTWC